MLKKIITLFKLGRKVAKSDILNITSKFQEPPIAIKIIFKIYHSPFLQKKNQLLIKMKVNDCQIPWSQWEQPSLN